VFYEESDKDEILKLKTLNLPIIIISSFAFKEEIDKIDPEITIFDPNVPSKIYNAITTSKEKKVITRIKRETKEKPIYQLKALIAEDNPINRKLLQTKLKSMGIESDTANNGLEVFNKYSMNPEKYDVIFMDIQMPVMDGVEATQEILEFEKEEEIPHTPIIAVTANVLKGDRERFLGAGMDDYISKPIETKELERVLENVAKHKYAEFEEIETENTKEENQIPTSKIEENTTTSSNNEEKIIIATESSFLLNYLKNVLDIDFDSAMQLNELNKKLNEHSNAIILIEDEFNDADMSLLIKSIKQVSLNVKIILIGDRHYDGVDDIIPDLNPEAIKNTINSIKGNK